MTHHWRMATLACLTAATTLLGVVVAQSAAAESPTCTANVDQSGLSAAVVAHANQVIAHQTVDAAGCDIGIYVGSRSPHVSIVDVTVTGANFQGILAERTSNLVVERSRITGNGFHSVDPKAPALEGSGVHSFVPQAFGISLFGVSKSKVSGNDVYNNGRGGIGIMDVGAFNPGTKTQNKKTAPVAASHDVIVNNRTWANYAGCGIVVATQNPGGMISDLTISGNYVTGTGMSAKNGPDIGGIVVAANPPGSRAVNVVVSENTVSHSFEGGIIVNAEAFNTYTKNVRVMNNIVVRGNNYGAQEAPKTAGVIVFANPQAPVPPKMTAPMNKGTVVAGNVISGQFYGVWSAGSAAPAVSGNVIHVTAGGTPVFHS